MRDRGGDRDDFCPDRNGGRLRRSGERRKEGNDALLWGLARRSFRVANRLNKKKISACAFLVNLFLYQISKSNETG